MSPTSRNAENSMCKKNVKPYGTIFECPWRCNMEEYSNQKKHDIIFNQEMSTGNIKTCSVDNQDIDCGGCVPLRYFN
jgi:hypothetical protein